MLKSVLALLLSKFVKKSDTEFIAAQPMAGDYAKKIDYYNNYIGDMVVTNTAPHNGWAFVTCGNFIKLAMLTNNRSGISVRLENGESDKNYLQWPHLILPCAKGDRWQVTIYTKIGQTEGTVIRFIPSIGG